LFLNQKRTFPEEKDIPEETEEQHRNKLSIK
jgi:hypothetical protein